MKNLQKSPGPCGIPGTKEKGREKVGRDREKVNIFSYNQLLKVN